MGGSSAQVQKYQCDKRPNRIQHQEELHAIMNADAIGELLTARRAAIAHPRASCAPGCTCLLCTFAPARTPYPRSTYEYASMNESDDAHVFPTKSGTTFAAIYVPNGVVASSHWTIIGLSLDNVDTSSLHRLRVIFKTITL